MSAAPFHYPLRSSEGQRTGEHDLPLLDTLPAEYLASQEELISELATHRSGLSVLDHSGSVLNDSQDLFGVSHPPLELGESLQEQLWKEGEMERSGRLLVGGEEETGDGLFGEQPSHHQV